MGLDFVILGMYVFHFKRVLPAILLKMGQISATPTMAIPVLQFLSSECASHDPPVVWSHDLADVVAVPVLYTGFVEQQYLSVFAIVFPYTDARKWVLKLFM